MVNGQCSVPRCDMPTTGPFIELGDAVNMGVACHIYSAAENGPRGRGGKDKAFIQSEANGIWCCQYHAGLIDKKKGLDYSAPTLFAWKKLAEARVRKKMNDIPSPLGWVDSVEIVGHRANADISTKVSLSRFTILCGKNGAGKTALLEAAAAVNKSIYFERIAGAYTIQDGRKLGVRIEANIIYTTVDTLDRKLHILTNDFSVRRLLGSTPCLLPPGDIEIIFCSENDSRKSESEDDVVFLMRALNVDRSALEELIAIGPSSMIDGTIAVRDAMEEDDSGMTCPRRDEWGKPFKELTLTRTIDGKTYTVSYDGLSVSEQRRLLIALSITKAREVAKQKLTLLAIEVLANNFDEKNFKHLLGVLKGEDFQSVVSLPPPLSSKLIEIADGEKCLRDLGYLRDWSLREVQQAVL